MKIKIVLSALIVLCSQSYAFAGGVDGGGGRSVVCRNATGAIASAEMLDLYEGRVMFGLNIVKSSAPMRDQVQKALQVIPPTSRNLIEVYADRILQNMRLTAPGTQLLPVDDSFEVVLPKNCAAEQLANYYNDNLILVSGDIWASLGETDRAALILHEAVYAVNRIVGAKDSRQSRHVVGNLFASGTQWVDVKDGLPKNALICISGAGALFMSAYQDQNKDWILQFQILGNSYVVSKKWTRIMGNDFDFNEAKAFPIVQGEDRIGNSFTTGSDVQSAFENSDLVTITKTWEAVKDSRGRIIRGFQTPRYYLSWTSGTFPKTSFADMPLNCSVTIGN